MSEDPYRRAGVDLSAAEAALEGIREEIATTRTPQVLGAAGGFGGLYRLDAREGGPVLVASTDGVGTKTLVAAALGRWRGVGGDLVRHGVNDVLAQGARPLFFLDYLASARLEPATVREIVAGVAAACRAEGMPLLGGETAEMPGVYHDGAVDLVGTVVGVVAGDALVDGSRVREGDLVLGLASGGLQTNGFSLARAVAAGRYDQPLPSPAGDASEGPGTVGDALLAEHRSFRAAVEPLLDARLVSGMAHVTGGGLPGNLPRSLPPGLGVRIDGNWPEPSIFAFLRERGAIPEVEMRRVFNLGVGFAVFVRAGDADRARAACPEPLLPVGRVVAGEGVRWA